MPEETNGQGKSRLDRIEELLERHVIANEAAHDQFRQQHRELLTAQVVMVDNMNKMAETMNKLEVKLGETSGKLDALIAVVDGWIRSNPR